MEELTNDLFKIIERLNKHIDSTNKKITRIEKQTRANSSLSKTSGQIADLRLEVVYMLKLGRSISRAVGSACKRQSVALKAVSESKSDKKDF